MDLRFSPEDEAFRAEVRAFLHAELPERRPDGVEGWRHARAFVRKLAQRGWLTMAWPKEWGGGGAGHIRQLVFNEEMAYAEAPSNDLGVDRVGPTIMLHGTDKQKQRFLPPIVRGEAAWCQGFSEPNAGSDLASLQTRAVQDGDSFVVNGSKIWTSMAHLAEWMILLARTNPDAPKHRGISFFLLDMSLPGITVRPLVDMLGRHTFNEVFFDNVRVPRDCLVGEQDRGWYVATTTLDFERSGIQRVIGGRRTCDMLIACAAEQVASGATRPAYAAMCHRLAELVIEYEVGRMLAYRVAWLQSRGQVPNYEASVSKTFGTELTQRLARTGMELLALDGQLAPGSPWAPLQGRIESLYLNSAALTIAAGTSEINRGIIATRGLGLPRA
ncbi:MAG TPA: acyl-CoA dehydrogenase family protein [Dehalococcoidia bacterium]|nr:acyl-CoA dehydrogenase family protein [Dehalococcoidia bacterium]